MEALKDIAGRIRWHSDSIFGQARPITHVAIVFDKSGSMASLRDRAVKTINEQIQQLKSVKDQDIFVTLVTFNGFIDVLYENRPVRDIPEITASEYVPNGSTALNDALKVAIEVISTKTIGILNEAFLVVAVTDGEENASFTTTTDIKSRMEKLQDTNKWTFSFMISNINERAFLHSYGAQAGNVRSFTSTVAGMANASDALVGGSISYFEDRASGKTATPDFYDTNTTKTSTP